MGDRVLQARRAVSVVGSTDPGLSPGQRSTLERVAAAAEQLHEEVLLAAERDEVLVLRFLDDGSGESWPVRVSSQPRADVAAKGLPKVSAPAVRKTGETAACWVLASQGPDSSVCTRLGTAALAPGGEA